MKTPRESKRFSMLIAAIRREESAGARVVWCDLLDGGDVVVVERSVSSHRRTIIEIRQDDSSIEVGQIEAFMGRAREARANRRVLVSLSEFQSECFALAEANDVELMTLSQVQALPSELFEAGLFPFSSSCSGPERNTMKLPERIDRTEEEKLFGRYHELLLLLIGVLLTAILGASLTACFQRKMFREKSEMELGRIKSSTALQTYEELDQLLGTLYVESEDLLKAFRNGKEPAAASERYFEALREWRAQSERLRTRLQLSFGIEVARLYSLEVAGKYRLFDLLCQGMLESAAGRSEETLASAGKTLLEIRESSHDVTELMLEHLLSGGMSDELH